jgi:hypothetical protein
VRAVVRAQQTLRADPQLAVKAAQRLFPAEEASLIAYEVARDAPFYNPTITEEMVAHIGQFARTSAPSKGRSRTTNWSRPSSPLSGRGKARRALGSAVAVETIGDRYWIVDERSCMATVRLIQNHSKRGMISLFLT